MSNSIFDVVGIGNAIVDVLAHAEDSFLDKHGLAKGAMTIIDDEAAENLYMLMGSGVEVSGGSAANTITGIASIGGRGAFVGKVCNDQLGDTFSRDIRAAGVSYTTSPNLDGAPTARCLICVTPDAERTMQTFLGACVELGPEDVDEEVVGGSKVVYLEGYLYDPPRAKDAFIKAAKIAKQAGRQVSLSLSDPFCVDRHRDAFVDLVANHVDILFANEDEIKSLYQVDSFDEALQLVKGHCDVAALTRSSKGSVIVSKNQVYKLDAEKADNIVDTTGAGDAYAAGFLYGLTAGRDLVTCGRIGGIIAAEIISHYGARSKTNLKALLLKNLSD
jgi:sugar/nucleoside kinase (ribokinase family)